MYTVTCHTHTHTNGAKEKEIKVPEVLVAGLEVMTTSQSGNDWRGGK